MGIVLSKKQVPECRLLQIIEAHDGGVQCLSVDEESRVVATGGQDGLVRVWSPHGDEPCEPLLELSGHEARVTCITLCEDSVLTASADKTIRRWNIVDGRELFVCRGHQSVVTRLLCTGDFIFSCKLHFKHCIEGHVKTRR